MTSTPAEHRSVNRQILALAIPAIGTLVADPLLGAVDTAVAGRLGTEELGALGLAVGVLTAGTWIFNFLVMGTTTSVAQAVGRRDPEGAGRHVAHAASVAVAIGVFAGAVLALAAPTLVRAFGAVDSLIEPASTYLRVRAIGVPFLLLGFVGHGAFRGVADTRTPLLVVVGANLLNGLLDLLFVFGLGMGLAGIAMATVFAEVAAVVLMAVLIRRAGLPLAGHGLPGRRQLQGLLVVSRDLFLRTGGLVGGLLLVTIAAARVDATTAAAHQVLWQVFLLVAFVLDGFAIAGQALVGTALGSGDTRRAQQLSGVVVRWVAVGGAAIGLVLILLEPVVVGAFTPDAGVARAVGSAWVIACVGHLPGGIAFGLDGILMGAADYRYLRTTTVAAAATGGVLALIGVELGAGITWLWICVEVIMVGRAGLLLLRMRGGAWLTAGA